MITQGVVASCLGNVNRLHKVFWWMVEGGVGQDNLTEYSCFQKYRFCLISCTQLFIFILLILCDLYNVGSWSLTIVLSVLLLFIINALIPLFCIIIICPHI